MASKTAGIVIWRRSDRAAAESPELTVEVLVVHPGGPFWAKKDEHAWSIPKGEFDSASESPLDAAKREFEEEMGAAAPAGPFVTLTPFRASKKELHAFAVEGDFDASSIAPEDEHRSMVEMEWPPKSGRQQRFPEVDRAAWIPLSSLADKLHKGQQPIVGQVLGLVTQ